MNVSKIDSKIDEAWQELIKGYPIVDSLSQNHLEEAKNWYALGYYRAIKEVLLNGLPGS